MPTEINMEEQNMREIEVEFMFEREIIVGREIMMEM